MSDCNPFRTHFIILPHSHMSFHRSTVGALQLIFYTRPDISLYVQKICKFLHNLTNTHWMAVKRVFQYLKGT